MADFVAVIRRAVDGLASNTPETRAKVYEKARGAVQRQLENMKPRPPEEMLRRQMDKLELAITEVEGEHAEAAVVDDGFPYPGEEIAAVPAAAVAQAYAAEPEPVEPTAYRDEREQDYPETTHAAYEAEEEVRHEPVPEPVHEPVETAHVSPAWDQVDEPVAYEARDERAEEDAFAAAPAHQEPAESEPQYDDRTALAERAFFDEAAESRVEEDRFHAPVEPSRVESRDEDLSYKAPETYQAPEEPAYEEPASYEPVSHEQATSHEEPRYGFSGEVSGNADRDWHGSNAAADAAAAFAPHDWQQDNEHARKEAELDAAWNDVPELVPAGPVEPISRPAYAERVDAHFDQETHITAEPVRMPAAPELPSVAAARATEDAESFFADYVPSDLSRVDETKAAAAKADDAKQAERDPWSDLEDLIGYTKDQPQQPTRSETRSTRNDDDLEDLMPSPAKPYRVTPVRKRSYAGLVLGIVGLLVVAGGAYAVWINRDSLDELVGGLISSNSTGSSTAQQPPATPASNNSTPAGSSASNGTTPSNPATPPAANQQAANRPQTAPASPAPADGSAANPKFTQRLMADGSETDNGPGAAGTLAQNAEGQSVAQLNAPPATPAPAAGTAAPAAPAPSTPTAPPATAAPAAPAAAAPTANPADTPAIAGEKMFLYEERLGQSAPTAIDGSVSWSLLHEPGAKGGPQEPEVQGRITVPGRGLTALMTLKRNTDPSLPASHLIEIVFAVPPGFEGGAIDSVQRIAMKSTEQDRGNALIAVPAKITDDFHMIALNDFPDARTTNLDLLRTRNWIDIPVAYRNGRRALLTLQKGPEGEKAFNEAIAEWARMPAAPGSQ